VRRSAPAVSAVTSGGVLVARGLLAPAMNEASRDEHQQFCRAHLPNWLDVMYRGWTLVIRTKGLCYCNRLANRFAFATPLAVDRATVSLGSAHWGVCLIDKYVQPRYSGLSRRRGLSDT
jgi:hypothetical protein